MTVDPPYEVLVVDDEPDVLQALSTTLSRAPRMDCEVTAVESAEAALDVLQGDSFDLVLADYRLDGMNGAELLGEVRDRDPDVRRLLITGYVDLDIAVEAMEEADIHYYLQKPWKNEDLRLTVREALETGAAGGGTS